MAAVLPRTAALPTTLQWYRDGANWIVTLSIGALAGAVAYYDKFLSGHRIAIAALIVAMIVYSVSVLSGILFYFWVVTAANRIEKREALELSGLGPGNISFDDVAKDLNEALKNIDRLWYLMIISFFVAGLGLAISAIFYVADHQTPDATWSMQSVSASTGTADRSFVLAIDSKSGDTRVLCAAPGQEPTWRPMRAFGLSPAPELKLSTAECAFVKTLPDAPALELVWFGTGDSTLSPSGFDVIEKVVSSAHAKNGSKILLTAFADATGVPDVNQQLAKRRAESVGAALVKRGIVRASILVSIAAPNTLRFATNAGVREPANRVVVLEVR